MIIKECTDTETIKATFSVMQQLRPNLQDAEQYVHLVQSLAKTDNYKLVALFDDNNHCVTVAGYRIKRCLAFNGNLEMHIDDLVTDNSYRSYGFGKQMFSWLKAECKKRNYIGIVLDSSLHRKEAHKFYLREGMKETSLHFRNY